VFQLKLNGQLCVSCGICMDVCAPRAIDMRVHRAAKVEGNARPRGEAERPAEEMMTFPYLASPQRCTGCADCVRECPVNALELLGS
jgi:ferredoxin